MKKCFKFFGGFFILACLTVILSSCGSSNKSSLNQIKSSGVLRVGMISSNPPYEFHTGSSNGESTLRGSDLHLIKKLAKALHVKYTIQSMDMNGLLPSVQAHKVDMLVTSLSPTPEREKAVDFSDVYYKGENVFSVKKSEVNKYNKNPKLLDHATIAVVNSSTQEPMVKKMYPNATIKTFTTVPDLALAVANNKADAFCIDLPTTKILLNQNKGLGETNIKHNDASKGAAIVLPKNTSKDLKEVVNKVIHENKDNYKKWVVDEAKYVK